MNVEQEITIIKTSLESLRKDVQTGFHTITKKISEINEKLEDRTVQNGKQDVLLETHKDLLNDVKKTINEHEERLQTLELELEKRDNKYLRWLASLTVTTIGILLGIIKMVIS